MSLPAALTWLQLLPNGTRFACTNAPEWFESMLRAHAAKPGASAPGPAAVVWGKSSTDIETTLSHHDAVVAINCPHVTTSRLRAAGYSYVRRYAALPRLQNARWFICLDSAKAAASSFSLYTPSRASAKLKKAAARTLARLRVPGWFRDEIIIASRQPSPLESKLAELFPGTAIRLALSSGAPEPAINRKPSAAVIDGRGNVLAFAKIAVSTVSRTIVEHEAEMLRALADRPRFLGVVPRLLFAGEVDGRYITVQSPLPGKPPPAAFTGQHGTFLGSLSNEQKMAAETNVVIKLGDRIDALHPRRPDLRELYDAILPTLEQTRVCVGVVHGDFAPWNLRTHNGKLGAFDWEYGELDGIRHMDELHFYLQHGLEMQRWDVDTAVEYLRQFRDDSLLPEQKRAVQAVYLLDQVVRLLGEGYTPEHDMVATYLELINRLEVPKREAALV